MSLSPAKPDIEYSLRVSRPNHKHQLMTKNEQRLKGAVKNGN